MAEPTKKAVRKSNPKPVRKQSADMNASATLDRQPNKSANRPTSKPVTPKSSNNAYKKGKLSKNARFSPRKINWTLIIVLGCLIGTFVLAIIVGNILGEKAENSNSTTSPESSPSDLVPPSIDKISPQNKLHAYCADMTGADPEKSLSELTAIARSKGNALFVSIKNAQNEIIYTSEKTTELGFDYQENLTLSRLKNHFEYYDDFAVGFFSSDFSAKASTEEALQLQTAEILLLKEAADLAFDQIIIEFSDDFAKNNIIYYQTYLLNLKLACPEIPIGIKLSQSFLSNADNAGDIAKLLEIADFFALDLAVQNADEIKTSLSPLVYFTERYDSVIIISNAEENTLEEKIAALGDKGIENYVVY